MSDIFLDMCGEARRASRVAGDIAEATSLLFFTRLETSASAYQTAHMPNIRTSLGNLEDAVGELRRLLDEHDAAQASSEEAA